MANDTSAHQTDGKAKNDRKERKPLFPTLSAAEVSYANELKQLGYVITEESVIRYAMLTSNPNVDPDTITEREIENLVYDEIAKRRAARTPALYEIGQSVAIPAAIPPAKPQSASAPAEPSDEQVLRAVERMAERGKVIIKKTRVDKVEIKDSILADTNIGLDGKLEVKDAIINRSNFNGKGDLQIKDAIVNRRKQLQENE